MRHARVSKVGMIALVGLLVLAGDAYADSDKKDKNTGAVPRVVDANNNLVGQVVGTKLTLTNPIVALNISVPSIIVQVTPDHFAGNADVSFTSANCSGQPYFDPGQIFYPLHLSVFPIVAVANGILYGPRANSAPVTIAASSMLPFEDGICRATAGPASLVIADLIIDLNPLFTPPYRFVYP